MKSDQAISQSSRRHSLGRLSPTSGRSPHSHHLVLTGASRLAAMFHRRNAIRRKTCCLVASPWQCCTAFENCIQCRFWNSALKNRHRVAEQSEKRVSPYHMRGRSIPIHIPRILPQTRRSSPGLQLSRQLSPPRSVGELPKLPATDVHPSNEMSSIPVGRHARFAHASSRAHNVGSGASPVRRVPAA
jgi:hypothetical protein